MRPLTFQLLVLYVFGLLFASTCTAESRYGALHAESATNYGQALTNIGVDAFKTAHYFRAIRVLTAAIQEGGPSEAFKFRGRAFGLTGKPDKAISDLTRYIGSRPEDPDGYVFRGEALCFLNEPEKAIPDFEAALKLDLTSIRARLGLRSAEMGRERPGTAIQQFRQALSEYLNDVSALVNLAQVCWLAGDTTEARTHGTRVLQPALRPNRAENNSHFAETVQKRSEHPLMSYHESAVAGNTICKLLPTAESGAREPIWPGTGSPAKVLRFEDAARLTGVLWHGSYMGARVTANLNKRGPILNAVVKVVPPGGREHAYHLSGTYQDGNIYLTHHCGYVFRGEVDATNRITGSITTKGGVAIPIDIKM